MMMQILSMSCVGGDESKEIIMLPLTTRVKDTCSLSGKIGYEINRKIEEDGRRASFQFILFISLH